MKMRPNTIQQQNISVMLTFSLAILFLGSLPTTLSGAALSRSLDGIDSKRSSANQAAAQVSQQSGAYRVASDGVRNAQASQPVAKAWDDAPAYISTDQHPLISVFRTSVQELSEGLRRLEACLRLGNRQQAEEEKRQCVALIAYMQRHLNAAQKPRNLALNNCFEGFKGGLAYMHDQLTTITCGNFDRDVKALQDLNIFRNQLFDLLHQWDPKVAEAYMALAEMHAYFVEQMKSHEAAQEPGMLKRTLGGVKNVMRTLAGGTVAVGVGSLTTPAAPAVGLLGWLGWKKAGKPTLATIAGKQHDWSAAQFNWFDLSQIVVEWELSGFDKEKLNGYLKRVEQQSLCSIADKYDMFCNMNDLDPQKSTTVFAYIKNMRTTLIELNAQRMVAARKLITSHLPIIQNLSGTDKDAEASRQLVLEHLVATPGMLTKTRNGVVDATQGIGNLLVKGSADYKKFEQDLAVQLATLEPRREILHQQLTKLANGYRDLKKNADVIDFTAPLIELVQKEAFDTITEFAGEDSLVKSIISLSSDRIRVVFENFDTADTQEKTRRIKQLVNSLIEMTGGIKALNGFVKKYRTVGQTVIAAATDAVHSEKTKQLIVVLQKYVISKLKSGEKAIDNVAGWILDITKQLGGATFGERDLIFLLQSVAEAGYERTQPSAQGSQQDATDVSSSMKQLFSNFQNTLSEYKKQYTSLINQRKDYALARARLKDYQEGYDRWSKWRMGWLYKIFKFDKKYQAEYTTYRACYEQTQNDLKDLTKRLNFQERNLSSLSRDAAPAVARTADKKTVAPFLAATVAVVTTTLRRQEMAEVWEYAINDLKKVELSQKNRAEEERNKRSWGRFWSWKNPIPDKELIEQRELFAAENIQAEYTPAEQQALANANDDRPTLASWLAKDELDIARNPGSAQMVSASLRELALICPSLSNAYAAVKSSVFEPLMKIKQAQATT